MNKTVFTVPLILMAMLLVFAAPAFAHEGEDHGEKKYEEGSGGSATEMDRKSRMQGHEYKDEHGMEHYDNKYENEKHKLQEEGSGMKDDAHRMKEEMERKRKEEGSKMQ